MEPTRLLGVGDENVKLIEESIPAKIIARGETIKIRGQEIDVKRAHEVLHEMMQTLSSKGDLTVRDVQKLITLSKSDPIGVIDGNSAPDSVIYFGDTILTAQDIRNMKQFSKYPSFYLDNIKPYLKGISSIP